MKKIAIIGSGTMGNGIAHIFAQKNFQISLIDISSDILEKARETISKNLDRQIKKKLITESDKDLTLSNIDFSTKLEKSVQKVDLAIEAATENLDTKLKIFEQLDRNCDPKTILASNTSSISITKISSATQRPSQVVGMHFMNPVPVMKLVEIIKGYRTGEETLQKIKKLTEFLDKIPVIVNDYPGFISNRILLPMINEAIYALYEGVAGVREIDSVMKLGMAHPMGPLQLADFIGLDVCLSILNVLYDGFGKSKYFPCPLLVNMVAAGNLGVKSGEGFYNWQEKVKELIISKRFRFNKYYE